MMDLLWLVVIVLVSIAFGLTVLRALRLAPDDLPREIAFGGALGLGILGYGVFALAALHWVSPLAAVLLLAGCAILSVPALRSVVPDLVSAARGARASRLVWAGIFLFALHAAIHVVSSFNPPIDLDVLGYHLPIAKLSITLNQLVVRPDIVYSNWPLHQEMLFQLGLLLSGDALAQLVSFYIATLTAFAIWACARQRLGSNVAMLAALIYYTIPVIGYEASIAYVDVGVALFSLLACLAVWKWRETSRAHWLALAAVMAGFAPAFKLSGAFIPALLFFGVVWLAPQGKNRVASGFVFAIIAGAVVSPWLIRTWVATGNPFTPYAFDLIGARGWTASAAHQSTAMFAPFGMGRDLLSLVALPWNLTMNSTAFGGGNIGPIFLAAFPLLLLARPIPPAIRAALVLTAAYFAIWFAVVQEVRFLVPILPLPSLVIAYTLVRWAATGRIARSFAVAIMALTVTANLILLASNFARPPGSVPPTKSLAVILGREARSDYLHRVLASQGIVDAVNALPQSSRVLLLGLSDVYYLDRDFIRGFPIEQPLFDAYELSSEEAVSARVHALQATHLVINYNRENGRAAFEGPGAPASYISALEDFTQRDLTLVSEANNYRLFAVRQ